MTGSSGIKKWLQDFMGYLRVDQWYYGKLPLMWGFCSALFLIGDMGHLGLLLIVQVQLFIFLAFGYMINNVSDLEVDRAAGKKLFFPEWSRKKKLVASLLMGAAGIISLYFLLSLPELGVALVCYLLAWIYSFPPRLKEHVSLGPLTGAFTQLPAPALTVALVFDIFSPVLFIYLIVMLLYNLRMMLVHQLIDRDNDLGTSISTTAVVKGKDFTYELIRFFFCCELLMTFLLFIVLIPAGLPPFLLLTLIFPGLVFLFMYHRNREIRLDTYYYIPLADIHESWLPLIVSVALALTSGGSFIWGPPLFLLFFIPRHLERWQLPYELEGDK